MKSFVRILNSEFRILNVIFVLTAACRSEPAPRAAVDLPPAGPITIGLAGDTSATEFDDMSAAEFLPTLNLVRAATFSFTNLEVTLLDPESSRRADARPAPRWIYARGDQSPSVRMLGFSAVSLANNHAMDFGAEGLLSTLRALDAAGIVHAGAGSDLAAARAPALVGNGARRVALIAVTASASDQSRASASQQDIQGRPGVNPLLFDASITVDPDTYRTLAESVTSLQAGPPPGDRQMTMFGRRITKGETTRVDFTLNQADEQNVLAVIREARQKSELVILSVHSHEPSNDSEEPASFLRQFARDAVDAGAHLVVGHGPHRLRGMEIYKGVPIFYSLGNFLYRTAGLDFRAADQFDAGTNLYTAALGGSGAAPSPFAELDQPWWWEGLFVVAATNGGVVSDLKIYPISLSGSGQEPKKGLPLLAVEPEGGAILRQFAGFSRRLGTELPEPSGPFLDVPIPENR